ncbi:ribonuclease H-like domain-containing protein [Tanacetum coccineum]|uniref:Ribonuclease H-like domain-containing protein n=1 Tax=Tanacetum coccineum TaxID=301880 RepID=A0ABQ5BAS8_9ASTR
MEVHLQNKSCKGVETYKCPLTLKKRHKRAKCIASRRKKRFGGNAADTKDSEKSSKAAIYEPEIKGTSSLSTNTQNVAFMSLKNTSSRNGAVNTAYGVTTASTQATTVNSTTIDNLSDAVIYYTLQGVQSTKNQENKKVRPQKTVPLETTSSNALISCDGAGYDWSDQAEEGLESVEARLLVYKKNESVYEEDIKVLKREIHLREVAITELRRKLELAQKQKDEIQLTVENFENSSKNLSKLIDCQIVDKCKIGLGYNVVPPPYTGNFMPPKPDLSFSGLEEFVNEPIVSEPTVKKPEVETSEAKASADKPKVVRKNNGAPIIEEWVSDSEDEAESKPKIEKKTVKPSFAKIEFVKSKKQVKSPRKTTVKQGSNFEMINKACYVCGSFDHLQYDCNYHQRKFNNKEMVKPVWNYTQRVNHQNFYKRTHPNPKRNMVPKAVLMRSGLVSLTTARPVNTAQPKTIVNNARPMTNGTKVNTAKPKAVVNAARPKVVLNAYKGNQQDLKEKGVIDSGCSRHMTGNMSYLTEFEEIDGGYFAFGGSPKGRKSTSKGTIKTEGFNGFFFLATKDETSGILKSFITRVENLIDQKVKVIRCPVTILNTIDHLGKFDGKTDEGFFVGYSVNSKAFRLFNSRTRIVEEEPAVPYISPNGNAGTKVCDDAGKARMETIPGKDYILLPLWTADSPFSQSLKISPDVGFKPSSDDENPRKDSEFNDQEKEDSDNSTNNVNVASTNEVNAVGVKTSIDLPDDPNMLELEDMSISMICKMFGAEADITTWMDINLTVLFQLQDTQRSSN